VADLHRTTQSYRFAPLQEPEQSLKLSCEIPYAGRNLTTVPLETLSGGRTRYNGAVRLRVTAQYLPLVQLGMAMVKKPRRSKLRGGKVPGLFDVQAFLNSTGLSRRAVEFRRSQHVYTQGDAAKNVLYIRQGGVKLCVVNEVGKEVVVAMFGPGDFFGEGCLADQAKRLGTAIAITSSVILLIEKNEMSRVPHEEHAFSDLFIAHVLSRNIRVEADLVDQLFNSTEKRLARALLLLVRYGKQQQAPRVLPKMSQQMLAEMIGASRSRVSQFMNKFKRLGFISYVGGLKINSSLLSVVLHD